MTTDELRALPPGPALDREVHFAKYGTAEVLLRYQPWSTDPACVGPLLVEAARRGWKYLLNTVDASHPFVWFYVRTGGVPQFSIHIGDDKELPAAVAKAFVLAAWAAKGGA